MGLSICLNDLHNPSQLYQDVYWSSRYHGQDLQEQRSLRSSTRRSKKSGASSASTPLTTVRTSCMLHVHQHGHMPRHSDSDVVEPIGRIVMSVVLVQMYCSVPPHLWLSLCIYSWSYSPGITVKPHPQFAWQTTSTSPLP